MKTKATLTLTLTYEGPDATEKMIERLLDFMVEHAAGNGMFTGDADMVVDEWSHHIDLEDASTCQRCEYKLDEDGRCTNETCPFCDYSQDDLRGWAGHPDWNDRLEQAGVYDGTYKPDKD